jgi:hypothetical protein
MSGDRAIGGFIRNGVYQQQMVILPTTNGDLTMKSHEQMGI